MIINFLWRCVHVRVVNTHLIPGRSLHDHSRSDSKWGYGQHCENHPLGPSKLGVHAQDDVLLIGDALEYLMHTLWAEQDLLLLRVLIHMLPLGVELQACAPDHWLVTPAAAVTLGGQRVKECVRSLTSNQHLKTTNVISVQFLWDWAISFVASLSNKNLLN